MRFADGSYWWMNLPDSLDKALHEGCGYIHHLSLAPDNSNYILITDQTTLFVHPTFITHFIMTLTMTNMRVNLKMKMDTWTNMRVIMRVRCLRIRR